MKKPRGGRGNANFDRNRMIVILMERNESPTKIGKQFKITDAAVHRIYKRDKAKYSHISLSTGEREKGLALS